jgi:hypothetical protein
MDAREFIRKVTTKEYIEDLPDTMRRMDHVYMNLPVLALDFLDVFCGLFTREDSGHQLLKWDKIFVHVYGFSDGENEEKCRQQFCARVRKGLRFFEESDIKYFNCVKDVSSNKSMFCLGFYLKNEDLFYKEDAVNQKVVDGDAKVNAGQTEKNGDHNKETYDTEEFGDKTRKKQRVD